MIMIGPTPCAWKGVGTRYARTLSKSWKPCSAQWRASWGHWGVCSVDDAMHRTCCTLSEGSFLYVWTFREPVLKHVISVLGSSHGKHPSWFVPGKPHSFIAGAGTSGPGSVGGCAVGWYAVRMQPLGSGGHVDHTRTSQHDRKPFLAPGRSATSETCHAFCKTCCWRAGRDRVPRRVRSVDHTSRGTSACGCACVHDYAGRKHDYVPREGDGHHRRDVRPVGGVPDVHVARGGERRVGREDSGRQREYRERTQGRHAEERRFLQRR